MRVEVRDRGGVPVVCPKGSFFGGSETDEFRNAVEQAEQRGNRKLIVDLGKTVYMNSTALGVLIEAHLRYASLGGKIRLCRISKSLNQIFVVTKLCLVFGDDQYETEEEALRSLSVDPTGFKAPQPAP